MSSFLLQHYPLVRGHIGILKSSAGFLSVDRGARIGEPVRPHPHFSNGVSISVGFGMAPRGEVAMIVALIGLEVGLIRQGIYVAIVLMSLLTTIITPIVYRNWFYKGECTYGTDGAPSDEGT